MKKATILFLSILLWAAQAQAQVDTPTLPPTSTPIPTNTLVPTPTRTSTVIPTSTTCHLNVYPLSLPENPVSAGTTAVIYKGYIYCACGEGNCDPLNTVEFNMRINGIASSGYGTQLWQGTTFIGTATPVSGGFGFGVLPTGNYEIKYVLAPEASGIISTHGWPCNLCESLALTVVAASTPTPTPSPTLSDTLTPWPTDVPTYTFTDTPVDTDTSTPTSVATPTDTDTPWPLPTGSGTPTPSVTATPTVTPTITRTLTPTPTGTWCRLQVENGALPANPVDAGATVVGGVAHVYCQNYGCGPSGCSKPLGFLSFGVTVTGNLSSEILAVELWSGDTLIDRRGMSASMYYSGTFTGGSYYLKFVLSPYASGTIQTNATYPGYSTVYTLTVNPILPSTPVVSQTFTPTWTPTVTPSWTPVPTDTNTPIPTDTPNLALSASPTPTRTWTGTPIYTDTPTRTFTPTETWTSTGSPTRTPTPTTSWTPVPTDTDSPTHTETPTCTQTSTPNSTFPIPNSSIPLVYPNPSQGAEQVQIAIPGLTGASDIKVKVLTVGFRKVREETFRSVPKDGTVTLRLRDNWNTALGNGLYYVLIGTPAGRYTEKLIVLR